MSSTVRFLSGRRTKSSGFALRWIFIVCSVSFVLLLKSNGSMANQDTFLDPDDVNDFAEFDLDEEEFENVKREDRGQAKKPPLDEDDDFDDEEEEEEGQADPVASDAKAKVKPFDQGLDEDEALVEDDDEFAHFADDEEFEGYGSDEGFGKKPAEKTPPPKTIKITNVPAHLRNNWESYYLEILMVAGIVVYFLNFFTGKSKNHKIASTWFESHRPLLESNFALVGDDGSKNIEEIDTPLLKESEHLFTLWCSGRAGCESMCVDLKLLKRQDLVSVIANIMKPAHDQVHIRVNMHPDDMDSFVFCLAHKKAATKLSKEMNDLSSFCPERRSAEKYGVPAQFMLMAEMAEVSSAMLDSKMIAVLNKYPESIDSIHISDQFTGPKPQDDQVPEELPKGKKVLIFAFNIPLKKVQVEEAVDNMKHLLLLVFYMVDKLRRYRLSREGKNKAEKNRAKVAEAHWKSIHVARAEKAQEERERKRRELKDKIREIEDPERQRKLEEREARRDKKKAAPKMKQLKVKAM
ncbi:hypothetical protein TCAL_09638 [Tigriopus californicus]|uniref:PAT complex subunit CCDC47 n=1 Tax=Tigriopus californicus TaxID=6832 RepID=A0A553P049_TIGCA|nr:PAT complex subunit CCDC47-like [Tigriopus californicus]TRY71047.1 hypothetical protein TCAL_09638 [Tigriopus californicus]